MAQNGVFTGWQTPNPYNNPRRLGESCSIHNGPLVGRVNGTMGGCILLTKGGVTKLVGLTNNHVVNEQKDADPWNKFTIRPVVIPSDGDHNRSTKLPNVWMSAASRMHTWFNANPDKCDPQPDIKVLSDKLIASTHLPPSVGADPTVEWENFANAWHATELDNVAKSVKALIHAYHQADLKQAVQLLSSDNKNGEWQAGFEICDSLTKLAPSASANPNFKTEWTNFQSVWGARDYKKTSESVKKLLPMVNPPPADLDQLDAIFDYLAVDDLKGRSVGNTIYTSGRCTSDLDPNKKPCLLDWALVDLGNVPFENTSPELQAFAKNVYTADQAKAPDDQHMPKMSCQLAGPPMKITKTADPTPGCIVFKIGRTTGCTVGKLGSAKVVYDPWFKAKDQNAKIGGGWNYPPSAKTEEWQAVSLLGFTETGKESTQPVYFSERGDSGSWVLDRDGNLIGLAWGVGDFGTGANVTPIRDVFASIEKVTGGWIPSLPH